MKRKLFTIIMMLVLTMAMVACGKEEENPNTELGSINTEVKDPEETPSKNDSTVKPSVDTETKDPETEKTPVVSTIKESEAVVDFDGVKLPMTITWDEFKQFMVDHNWTFEDDEENFPGGKKALSGNGFINTNCGKVKFKFDENENGTESVLMSIVTYKAYSPATISISGINAETSIDTLKEVLTPIENNEAGFYLDDYLEVYVSDATFSIVRTYFHMR